MKDEIKEILEDIKRHLDYVEATKQCSIRDNEMKVMYDYITNLHQIEQDHQKLNGELREELEDYKSRNEKAIEKLESIRTFGLRSGKTLFSTLINETIDILNGGDDNE
jgi:hypothetical protein